MHAVTVGNSPVDIAPVALTRVFVVTTTETLSSEVDSMYKIRCVVVTTS